MTRIKDEFGEELQIGMRVGCRQLGQCRTRSSRGLTLEGYEPNHAQPYITNQGRFALAIKDHQPDTDDWRKNYVRP